MSLFSAVGKDNRKSARANEGERRVWTKTDQSEDVFTVPRRLNRSIIQIIRSRVNDGIKTGMIRVSWVIGIKGLGF